MDESDEIKRAERRLLAAQQWLEYPYPQPGTGEAIVAFLTRSINEVDESQLGRRLRDRRDEVAKRIEDVHW